MRAVSVGSESVSRMMPNTARIAADTSVIAREWRLNHVERAGELAHREPDGEERHARARASTRRAATVDAGEVLARGGEAEHAAEHRADARRPAEAERGARDRRRDRAEAVEVRVEAELLVEPRRGEELRARRGSTPSAARGRRRCG